MKQNFSRDKIEQMYGGKTKRNNSINRPVLTTL